MTTSGEQEVAANPLQARGLSHFTTRLAGAVAEVPVIRTFARLWSHMLDDLAANGVVETVFATATKPRLLMLGAVIVIAVAIPVAFRTRNSNEDDISLSTRVAFLAFAYGIPLWFVLPYHTLVSAWMKLALVLLFGFGLAALILPGSRPDYRVPLLSLLGLLSIVTIFALGAIPGASQATCFLCDPIGMHIRYPVRSTKPAPTATATPRSETTLPPPVVTVVVVVEQPLPSTPQATQPPVRASEAAPTATPTCPDLAYPVARPPGATHLVQKGQTLVTLAAQYNTSVDALVKANGPYYPTLRARPDCVREGWWLIIPSG